MKVEGNKSKNVIYFVFLAIGLVIGYFLGVIVGLGSSNYSNSELYKLILITQNKESELMVYSDSAFNHYELASLSYELGNYDEVVLNCEIARDYWLKESQGYRNIKAELISLDYEDELIDIYVNLMEENVVICESMYEACEYLESASRYYKNDDYYMGGENIDAMNEKITDHDFAVRRYNDLIAEFGIELNKRLEQ